MLHCVRHDIEVFLFFKDRVITAIFKPWPITQPVFPQNIYAVKNNDHSRDTQPMGMKRIADIAMKQINNGVAQTTAGAPFNTHQL
jgi:hypothetical protein